MEHARVSQTLCGGGEEVVPLRTGIPVSRNTRVPVQGRLHLPPPLHLPGRVLAVAGRSSSQFLDTALILSRSSVSLPGRTFCQGSRGPWSCLRWGPSTSAWSCTLFLPKVSLDFSCCNVHHRLITVILEFCWWLAGASSP